MPNRRRVELKRCESIIIDGVEYTPINKMAEAKDGMKYVIIRTYSAGVFAGYLESKNGQEVVMRNARRIWSWTGAASLSQLAMEGSSDPKGCKYPCAVDRVELLQTIEILDVTEKGKKNIEETPIWKQ